MKRALAVFLVCALGACSLPGQRSQPRVYHELRDPGHAQTHTPKDASLSVAKTQADGLLLGSFMLFSRADGSRGVYQLALWSSPAPHRISELLLARLRSANLVRAVSPLGSGVASDYLLNSRIIDLHHDATREPGVVRLTIDIELIQRREARQIGARRIGIEEPVQSADAAGMAAATSRALARALDEVEAWVARGVGDGER
jgi:ABC-type uncharacterized transport system auxiliary subunit